MKTFLAVAIILGSLSFFGCTGKTGTEASSGEKAKEFTTKDLAGNPVRLADYRGKVVVIDFYAGWCPPCRAEMPNLVKLYMTHQAEGLEIIGVSLDRSSADAKAYAEKAGMTWVVTYESNGPVAQLYGVDAIPMTYVIDRNGNIVASGLRGQQLDEKVAEVLKQRVK